MRPSGSTIRRPGVAALVAGAVAFGAAAAPVPALAAPTVDFGDDGTLIANGTSIEVPVTGTCEETVTGFTLILELRVTQKTSDGIAAGVGEARMPCTGEAVTTSIEVPAENGSPFSAGVARGELTAIGVAGTLKKSFQIGG